MLHYSLSALIVLNVRLMNLNTIEPHYAVNTLCVTSFCDSDTKNNNEAIRQEGKENVTIL